MTVIYETTLGYELGILDLAIFIRSGTLSRAIAEFGSIKNQKRVLTNESLFDFTEIEANNIKYFYRKKAQDTCPECDNKLKFAEGCKYCCFCGWSACG